MDKISNLLFRFLWIKYICWRYFQDKPAKPIKPYSGYTWKYRRTRDYSVLTTQGISGSTDEPEMTICTHYSGYTWKYRRTRNDYLYSLLRVYLEVRTNQRWLSVLSTLGIPGSTDEPEMTLYSLLRVYLEVQTNQRWLCTHYSGYIWKYRRTRDDSVLSTQGISGSTDEPEMTLYSLLRVYLEYS